MRRALLLVAVTGCATPSVLRNPSFQAAKAPAPAMAAELVGCDRASPTEQIAPLYADRVRVARAQTSPAFQRAVCTFVGDAWGRHQELFNVPPSLRLVFGKEVEAARAQSLFVPVLIVGSMCGNRSATVTDGSGAVVGTVQSNETTCQESPRVTIYGLVFSAAGDLLWFGTPEQMIERWNTNEVDAGFLEVLGQVPADFVPATTGA